ncbi:nuclear transport factor 2 family protein [Microlunatus sp. Gsoil 973]|uniref:nuclear transport factor 2 family protein n=1 Tax=Microlunatus sp. Gsoil 973 TaxID=2672569 RepID=UPI0012B4A175|nr:nuclear transport factor 2 family protein [Microlunatus sp. Gsoil 973]QGN34583.1 nuclear transport factor 2 family protein [Microlunatus sp. Gsoil 973]
MISTTLQTTLDYFNAWTGGDFEAALTYISPEISCQTPNGPIAGLPSFRGFMEPFARSLVAARLLAAFGDERTALIMYDTRTRLVDGAPGAELHTVSDGLITSIKIIFDRQPFVEARARLQN